MAHESFENPEIAQILNPHFVCIKVDREERPDLDEIYMTAVQMMTGSGGWPMSVFLTPDLKPFFAGTYFPPDDRGGRIGFTSLLMRLVELWNEQPLQIAQSAGHAARAIRSHAAAARAGGELGEHLLAGAVDALSSAFDPTWGGFGGAPKFPPAGALSLLLRRNAATPDSDVLRMVTLTLDRMACGGIYDHVGGGFHRYSTDAQWLVPHFEKMLYDNALLAAAFLDAFQATSGLFYRRVASETLDYVLRDMTGSEGGFFSSEDADSDGEEGRFYVWTEEEILRTLGEANGAGFCEAYGVTNAGNFEGRNILHLQSAPPAPDESNAARMKQKLLGARARRVRPGRDDKVLASWNGLMIAAFVRGYRVLGEERYRRAAVNAAAFVTSRMMKDGCLFRSYRDGRATQAGFLDDYAFVADALIELYGATGDSRWVEEAAALCREMIGRFWDPAGAFYFAPAGRSDLLARMRSLHDGAEPSGNAMACFVLMKLGRLLDLDEYRQKAEAVLKSAAAGMAEMPRGHTFMLCALDYFLNPGPEIVLVGRAGQPDTHALWGAVRDRFLPNALLLISDPSAPAASGENVEIPLLSGKEMIRGRAAAYVCRNYACLTPATSAVELEKQLRR